MREKREPRLRRGRLKGGTPATLIRADSRSGTLTAATIKIDVHGPR
jgi:hypothetical protein